MSDRPQVLVSACLLGERVRYHGGDARIAHPILERWHAEGRLVAFCPEVAGGLTTPRAAAEISAAAGDRRVLTMAGKDVTSAFARGAALAAESCAVNGIRVAILKDGSPSCGTRTIYDGTFTAHRVAGQGIAAERLIAQGVKVFSESELDAADEYLRTLDALGP